MNIKIDGDLLPALQSALGQLERADGEVLFDFSSVRRVDPAAIRALEEFARTAEAKEIKVALSGVNVGIYKVLKLVNLAPRFSFVS